METDCPLSDSLPPHLVQINANDRLASRLVDLSGLELGRAVFVVPNRLDEAAADFVEGLRIFLASEARASRAGFAVGDQGGVALELAATARASTYVAIR